MDMKKLYKLHFLILPQSAHGKNLRTKLPISTWRKMSEEVRKYHYCVGCGKYFENIGNLEAHEEWTFKYNKQKLVGIYPLCKMCHFTVHAGRAEHLGKTDEIIKHYCEVNNISKKKAKKDLNKAWYKFYQRNRYKYKLNITEKKVWKKINNFLKKEEKILNENTTKRLNDSPKDN